MIIRFVATVLSLAFLVGPTLAQDTAFATFDLASEPVLDDPHDLTIGPSGLLYVADKFANKITILDPNTLAIVGSFGDGALFGVHDISFGPDGRAYIAVTGLNRVDVYEVNGTQGVFVESYDSLPRTEGAYAHPNGRLYAMASGIGTLVAFENGEPLVATRGLNGAHDVAGALDGTIWVADNVSRRLVQFDEDLNFLRVLNGAELGLIGARYIAIDDFGRIVAIDQDAHRALLIDPDAAEGSRLVGVIGDGLPGLGPGKFDNPEGVAAHGNSYFFSDSDNNRIVKYSVIIN
jgi:streptogramin lyase